MLSNSLLRKEVRVVLAVDMARRLMSSRSTEEGWCLVACGAGQGRRVGRKAKAACWTTFYSTSAGPVPTDCSALAVQPRPARLLSGPPIIPPADRPLGAAAWLLCGGQTAR
jgi:hypothetical protein